MSLASILLPGKKKVTAVDESLDEIFKSSAGPSSSKKLLPPSPSTTAPSLKRKKGEVKEHNVKQPKRSRVSSGDALDESSGGVPLQEGDGIRLRPKKGQEMKEKQEEQQVSSNSDSDGDSTLPVHETLVKSKGKKRERSKKVKYVPESETREQRDSRSIFIGNLPVQIVKSKALTKQLKRRILTFVPTAKIESIRFRSVTFQNPTTKIDTDEDEGPSAKQQRQQKRAAEWRAEQQPSGSRTAQEEEAEEKKGEKTYMTPAQKRRLAAIKGDLHEHAAATTNAYIVFAHPVPTATEEGAEKKSMKMEEVMDPFEAAREAVKKCDGEEFEGRTIRVDIVGKSTAKEKAKKDEAMGTLTDPKLSIFVGNLDFASGEDDLRAFFEKVMCEERGKRGQEMANGEAQSDEEDGEEEEEEDSGDEGRTEKADRKVKAKKAEAIVRKPAWVTRVRIVRDRDTQLGKGFAYVQFVDRECVDEVLALDAEKLKFAKRVLRIQRCKTVPGASTKVSVTAKDSRTRSTTRSAPILHTRSARPSTALIELPKGDPTLGTRLAGLPKEKRKEAKATDPTRVARRLAKKKARMALEKSLPKKDGFEKAKERVRERKEKKGTMNKGKKDGKRRVRSEKSIEKRNAKK